MSQRVRETLRSSFHLDRWLFHASSLRWKPIRAHFIIRWPTEVLKSTQLSYTPVYFNPEPRNFWLESMNSWICEHIYRLDGSRSQAVFTQWWWYYRPLSTPLDSGLTHILVAWRTRKHERENRVPFEIRTASQGTARLCYAQESLSYCLLLRYAIPGHITLLDDSVTLLQLQ